MRLMAINWATHTHAYIHIRNALKSTKATTSQLRGKRSVKLFVPFLLLYYADTLNTHTHTYMYMYVHIQYSTVLVRP